MTSTNDGKEVKSNLPSGPKGKTYFIELYKSLEAKLNEAGSASERTKHLCEAWLRIHNLCLHSATSTHPHLLSWLQKHTARAVLQTGWQSPARKEERASLAEAINVLIVASRSAAASRDGVSPPWEQQLVERGEWFKKILDRPWEHPVLNCLLNPDGTPPTDDEVLEWLTEERGVTFVMRLQTLVAEKQCDDIAVALATAVMDRVRNHTQINPDADQEEESKDKLEKTSPNFGDRLKEEAGFTQEVWELLTDIEFVLLHKRDSSRCIALAKQTPLRSAYQLIERLQCRLDTSPREKRLWKNSKEVAVLIAQVVITRCMVIGQCAGGARSALYCCARSLARLMPSSRLPSAAAALAAPAPTAAHLHTLAAAVDAQLALKTDASMKPFVCELYVRAITAGMNELERLKLKTEKEPEARSMEQTLATWFVQLGAVLASNDRFKCECALTAFSMHPSPQMYERIKGAPALPPIHLDSVEATSTEATYPAFGSWASDSRSQTNFVKTSETLNLKARQNQANVLSMAIFNEGEALGLSPELCQDITALLSGPRVKTLSWDMDRELLLENCRAYLERTHGGTKAVTTELKYLNLNPADFQYLPEEDEDENNIYYGIEKGYEHLVEPEPEDIWEDAYEHFEKVNPAYNNEEHDFIQPQRKKKTKKSVSNSDEDDPLSYVAETKRKEKKERPHSKERCKVKKRLTDPLEKKIPEDNTAPGDPLEIGEGSQVKKDKPKKVRKKKEKIPKPIDGSLSSLVGLKVGKSEKKPTKNFMTDNDADSQGKSSIQSMNSEEKLLYDGQFSMDDMISPRSSHGSDSMSLVHNNEFTMANGRVGITRQSHFSTPYKPASVSNVRMASPSPYEPPSPSEHYRNNSPVPIPEEVKSSISKLLEFRRLKSNAIMREASMSLDNHISPKAVAIPEIPKSYINKQQSEKIMELKQKVDGLLKQRKQSDVAIPRPVIQYANRNYTSTGQTRQSHSSSTTTPIQYNTMQKDRCFSTPPMDTDRFLNSVSLVSIYDKNEPPQSLNPFAGKSSPLSNMPERRQNVDISELNYQDYLHEFRRHNTYNQYAERNESTKKVIRPTSRVTPVVPNMKSEPQSPQSAKQQPQKKPDGSLNTFSRLSYYKNKQTDMRNKSQDTQQNQTQTAGSKLDGFIMDHLLQSQRSGKLSLSNDGQTMFRNYEKPQMNVSHPVIANMLQSQAAQAQNRPPITPTKTGLSENDHNDMLMLLRQQNTLNKSQNLSNASCAKVIPSMQTSPVASCSKTMISSTDAILDLNSSIMHSNPRISKPKEANKKVNEGKIINILSTSIIKSAEPKKASKLENTKEPMAQGKFKKTDGKRQRKPAGKPNTTVHKNPEEWENVMNAILKQKTPCRGPNALDMALNKSSFEKAFEESLQNPSMFFKSSDNSSVLDNISGDEYIHDKFWKNPKSNAPTSPTSITVSKANKKINSLLKTKNICAEEPKQNMRTKKSHNTVEKMAKQQNIEPKILEDLIQQNQIEITRKNINNTQFEIPEKTLKQSSIIKPRDAALHHLEIPKMHVQQIRTEMPEKVVKPTHFDIPKNTKQIIEASKKETKQVVVEKANKEAKHVQSIKKIPQEVQMKQFTYARPKQDDPFISGIPNSDYDLLDELMDDDLRKEIGELSSDEESYNASVQSFPQQNIKTDKKPANVVYNHPLNEVVAKHSHKDIVAKAPAHPANCKQNEMTQTVVQKPLHQRPNNKEPTLVKITPTRASQDKLDKNGTNVQNIVVTQVMAKPCQTRNYNNDNVLHTNQITVEPNVYIPAVPRQAPVQNVMLIPSDLVYDGYSAVQTPIQAVTNIAPNVYMTVNNASSINVYQTQFAAPVVSPLIMASAVTVPDLNVPCGTTVQSKSVTQVTQSQYSYSINELHEPTHSATARGNIVVVDNKLDPKVSSSVTNHVVENDMQLKPENVTVTNANVNKSDERKVLKEVQEKQTDEKRSQKVSDKDLKTQADQERLRKKRMAILNRKISHLCGVQTIALGYLPLRLSIPIEQKERDVVCKIVATEKDIPSNRNNLKELNNEVKSPATPDSCKQNKSETLQVRQILLRSSNKLKAKISSTISSPKPYLDKKLSPVISLDTTNETTSENDKSDQAKINKQKRVSKRIRNKSVTTPKDTQNKETKVAKSKVPSEKAAGTEKLCKKNKSIKVSSIIENPSTNQDFNTEKFFDIEAELLGSTIPKMIPINMHSPEPHDVSSPAKKENETVEKLTPDTEEPEPIQDDQLQKTKDLPVNESKSSEEFYSVNPSIESSDINTVYSNNSNKIEQISDNLEVTSDLIISTEFRSAGTEVTQEKGKYILEKVVNEKESTANECVFESIKTNENGTRTNGVSESIKTNKNATNEAMISNEVHGPDSFNSKTYDLMISNQVVKPATYNTPTNDGNISNQVYGNDTFTQTSHVKIPNEVKGSDIVLPSEQLPTHEFVKKPASPQANHNNISISEKTETLPLNLETISAKSNKLNHKNIIHQTNIAHEITDLAKSHKSVANDDDVEIIEDLPSISPASHSAPQKIKLPRKKDFKDSIVIENVTTTNNRDPLKKEVRIKLGNGKTFRGTVSGSVNIETLLEDPKIMSLLASQFQKPKKLYALKINVNKDLSNGNIILSSHVQQAVKPNIPLETVSLLSDDEDEDSPQVFETEYGKHKTNLMDRDIFTKHQNKLKLKSYVPVKKLSLEEDITVKHRFKSNLTNNGNFNVQTQPECVILDVDTINIESPPSHVCAEKLDEVEILSAIPSKYVQGVFDDFENILAPSNQDPKEEPIVLIDDSSNDSAEFDKKPEPNEKIDELKNKLLKDLGVDNILSATNDSTDDVQVTWASEAIDLTDDLVMETTKCPHKDDLIDDSVMKSNECSDKKLDGKVDYQKVINLNCFVKLVRCDHLVNTPPKPVTVEIKDYNSEENDAMPAPIFRSGSFSILEEFPVIDALSTNKSEYGLHRSSPVMEVYDTIALLLESKPSIRNGHKLSVDLLKCDSEWMITKKIEHVQCLNKLTVEQTSRSFVVPKLATLILTFIQKGDLVNKYNLLSRFHRLPISLKRKSKPTSFPIAKISKFDNLPEPQPNDWSRSTSITLDLSATDASNMTMTDDDDSIAALETGSEENLMFDVHDITPDLSDTEVTNMKEDVTLISKETDCKDNPVNDYNGENVKLNKKMQNFIIKEKEVEICQNYIDTVLVDVKTKERPMINPLDIIVSKYRLSKFTEEDQTIEIAKETSVETALELDDDIPIDCSNIDFCIDQTEEDYYHLPTLIQTDSDLQISPTQTDIEDDILVTSNSQSYVTESDNTNNSTLPVAEASGDRQIDKNKSEEISLLKAIENGSINEASDKKELDEPNYDENTENIDKIPNVDELRCFNVTNKSEEISLIIGIENSLINEVYGTEKNLDGSNYDENAENIDIIPDVDELRCSNLTNKSEEISLIIGTENRLIDEVSGTKKELDGFNYDENAENIVKVPNVEELSCSNVTNKSEEIYLIKGVENWLIDEVSGTEKKLDGSNYDENAENIVKIPHVEELICSYVTNKSEEISLIKCVENGLIGEVPGTEKELDGSNYDENAENIVKIPNVEELICSNVTMDVDEEKVNGQFSSDAHENNITIEEIDSPDDNAAVHVDKPLEIIVKSVGVTASAALRKIKIDEGTNEKCIRGDYQSMELTKVPIASKIDKASLEITEMEVQKTNESVFAKLPEKSDGKPVTEGSSKSRNDDKFDLQNILKNPEPINIHDSEVIKSEKNTDHAIVTIRMLEKDNSSVMKKFDENDTTEQENHLENNEVLLPETTDEIYDALNKMFGEPENKQTTDISEFIINEHDQKQLACVSNGKKDLCIISNSIVESIVCRDTENTKISDEKVCINNTTMKPEHENATPVLKKSDKNITTEQENHTKSNRTPMPRTADEIYEALNKMFGEPEDVNSVNASVVVITDDSESIMPNNISKKSNVEDQLNVDDHHADAINDTLREGLSSLMEDSGSEIWVEEVVDMLNDEIIEDITMCTINSTNDVKGIERNNIKDLESDFRIQEEVADQEIKIESNTESAIAKCSSKNITGNNQCSAISKLNSQNTIGIVESLKEKDVFDNTIFETPNQEIEIKDEFERTFANHCKNNINSENCEAIVLNASNMLAKYPESTKNSFSEIKIEYEDPNIGTGCMFSLKNNDAKANKKICHLSNSKEIIVNNCEHEVIEDIKIIMPKNTYACPNGLLHEMFRRSSRNMKRKKEMSDIKSCEKKYRKGKNIDYPKITTSAIADLAYAKEYKRIIDYCSTIKFSYARPFHIENIVVSDMHKSWPTQMYHVNEVKYSNNVEEILYMDTKDTENAMAITDPLKQTLNEEIENGNSVNNYKPIDINETNFNMGFGERSGRVIQKIETGITKSSAATLSDVKQYQPFSMPEVRKVNLNHAHEIETQKVKVNLMDLINIKEKVQSIFKNTAAELTRELLQDKKYATNDRHLSNFPFDLTSTEFMEVSRLNSFVNVVQINAAAQNPVICDPRVTHVSDASPSQCSDNSPGEDPQATMETEYTELTTANITLPLVQEYVQHRQSPPQRQHSAGTDDDVDESISTMSIVKIELMEEETSQENLENDIYENYFSPVPNNAEYSFEETTNTLFNRSANAQNTSDTGNTSNNIFSAPSDVDNTFTRMFNNSNMDNTYTNMNNTPSSMESTYTNTMFSTSTNNGDPSTEMDNTANMDGGSANIDTTTTNVDNATTNVNNDSTNVDNTYTNIYPMGNSSNDMPSLTTNGSNIDNNIGSSPIDLENRPSNINSTPNADNSDLGNTAYDYSYENIEDYAANMENNNNAENYSTNMDNYAANAENYSSNVDDYTSNVNNYSTNESYSTRVENYASNIENYSSNVENYATNADNTTSNIDNNLTNTKNSTANKLEEPQPEDLSMANSTQESTICNTFESQENESSKTDQIAHAMNAAGISSESVITSSANELVNLISQSAQITANKYTKPAPANQQINVITLQQALAQVLPSPLNHPGVSENQMPNNPGAQQVLHIVQGNNAQTVINKPNGTHLLHIVQNTSNPPANGLSLVDTGLQQGGNQLIHIVNNGNQNNAQFLKRVNLLTNLSNVQGSNEQKMIQFVCKSADGKSIQLNAGPQRSMVLRLHPSSVQTVPKSTDPQDLSSSSSVENAANNQDSSQEIKSRSVYEENYAQFIQNSATPGSSMSPCQEKSTSLPKFNQVFGKQSYQESQNENNHNGLQENSECTPEENSGNLEQPAEVNNPPLLERTAPPETTQAQPNPVQQIKQTISPMNIHTTMHGGVIYTRQIPVNIGGGQTINLITVPSTEMVDDSAQKQQTESSFVNQEGEQSSIIKLVPHHTPNNTNVTSEENNAQTGPSNEQNSNPQSQPQPVLTQMRIKLPMLSKGPHILPGARLVKPSFFQIQRNVIAGTNQPVYQQLVLTTAPSLGQTIRIPVQGPSAQSPQAQPILVQAAQHPQPAPHIPVQQVKHAPSSQHIQSARQAHSAPPTSQPQGHTKPDKPDSELSPLILEQLREFDMVLEQVKERSVQPTPSTTPSTPVLPKPIPADSTDGPALAATSVCEATQQVVYSVENNQPTNVVSYVNRKSTITSATTSFARSPDSSGIVDAQPSSTQVQITHTVTSKSSTADGGSSTVARPKKKKKKKSSSSSSAMSSLGSPSKTNSSLKPQEDEQTTQRILYILAEYKEQVENSPDKNKPAPRRRNQFPPTTGSKRKRSHCSSRALCRHDGVEMSPMYGENGENGDDSLITIGSEDSSCGTTFSECTECQESHSPEDSPTKVVRRLTFEQETTTQTITQTRTHTALPQRNVIVGDGQTITVARTTTATATATKPTTTVLMPANYLLPVSMIKGGQQIAIMTNRGPKILVGAGDANAGALLFQRLIGPGLKPVLARPGIRHIRLPATALHNLQALNIQTTPVTQVQPPDSTASQAPTPAPPDLVDTRAMSSPWQENQDKPERVPSPDCTEPWNLPSSSIADDYGYEEIVRTDNMERTILDAIPDRYSPDMEAQRIFDKMFDVDSKKSMYDSPRCGYDIDTSDGDDRPYQQVVQQRKDGRHHRVTHVSTAALRHKYAILEHELRLQKSLSEECEDLGVDSPSASDLFPEADILFGAPSPAHEQTIDQCNTPPPILIPQGISQPDLDDQIATDQLLTHNETRHDDLDLNLDVGEMVTVGEDGVATIPTINAEEFARSHPNTTFHTEPEVGEITIAQPPFTIAQAIKGRHITFHANRMPGTVVMAPQTTVISQATLNTNHASTVKFTDIDNMINSIPGPQPVNIPSVPVQEPLPAVSTRQLSKFDSLKDQGNSAPIPLSKFDILKDHGVSAPKPMSKFDSLLSDSKLQLANSARKIVHSAGNGTQVIRRLRYDEKTNTRTNTKFNFEQPRSRTSVSDQIKMRTDRAIVESMSDNASSPGQPELFWDSTTSERHESRFHFSESEKPTKSPFDELLNDSSAYGPHTRLDSVIKAARPDRTYERNSFDGMSASSDDSRPLRTYPPKRGHTQDTERHFTLKTTTTTTHELDRTTTKTTHHHEMGGKKTTLPRCQESEGRRRTGRGLVKRGCSCCSNGSSAPPKKRSRPKKTPPPEFSPNS